VYSEVHTTIQLGYLLSNSFPILSFCFWAFVEPSLVTTAQVQSFPTPILLPGKSKFQLEYRKAGNALCTRFEIIAYHSYHMIKHIECIPPKWSLLLSNILFSGLYHLHQQPKYWYTTHSLDRTHNILELATASNLLTQFFFTAKLKCVVIHYIFRKYSCTTILNRHYNYCRVYKLQEHISFCSFLMLISHTLIYRVSCNSTSATCRRFPCLLC